MAQDEPSGIVNHPWLVLVGLAGVCVVVGSLRPRVIDGDRPISSSAKVVTDICVMRQALDSYAANNGGRYPHSLQALVTPDELGHRYLSQTRVPRDPWQREYIYVRDPLNVMTLGADRKPGGTGDDADIDYASIVNASRRERERRQQQTKSGDLREETARPREHRQTWRRTVRVATTDARTPKSCSSC